MYKEIYEKINALANEVMDDEVFPTEEHGLLLLLNEIRDFRRPAKWIEKVDDHLMQEYNDADLQKHEYSTLKMMSTIAAAEAVYIIAIANRIMNTMDDGEKRATQEELEKFWEDK